MTSRNGVTTTICISCNVPANLQRHVLPVRNNGQNNSKRLEVKNLIREMKKTNPYVEGNIFKSVENVNLSTVIAYKKDGVKHHFLETYDDAPVVKREDNESE